MTKGTFRGPRLDSWSLWSSSHERKMALSLSKLQLPGVCGRS